MTDKMENLVEQVRQRRNQYWNEALPVPHLVNNNATLEEHEYLFQHTQDDVQSIELIDGSIFATFGETRLHGDTVGWMTTKIILAWISNCPREAWQTLLSHSIRRMAEQLPQSGWVISFDKCL